MQKLEVGGGVFTFGLDALHQRRFLDAAVLAEVLLAANERGERLADAKVLSRYERRRMPHNLALMAATKSKPKTSTPKAATQMGQRLTAAEG